MLVGLFVPCYVDQLYPGVAMATVEVLERHGVTVEYPEAQTCCGQPMANSGCTDDAAGLAERFLDVFGGYEHVVCPSGSCTAMVTHHYHGLVRDGARLAKTARAVHELSEFLVDILKIERPKGKFPHKVGLHQSCHGLRELRLGSGSERQVPPFSKTRLLLEGLEGIELVELARPDECCGFGGTFAVNEEAVSAMMGRDRVEDHVHAGAEIVTAVDMSCLMHLDGIIRREKRPLKIMHLAEILAAAGP